MSSENLRGEIAELTERWVANNYPIGSQTFSDLAAQTLSHLKSQNVVRLKSGSQWYPNWDELALNKAQANWLRENFRAVEELE